MKSKKPSLMTRLCVHLLLVFKIALAGAVDSLDDFLEHRVFNARGLDRDRDVSLCRRAGRDYVLFGVGPHVADNVIFWTVFNATGFRLRRMDRRDSSAGENTDSLWRP
jgi:hypothetical protein